MPHFTTTDSLKFKSYLLAHGVDTSTAEKVAARIQRKSKRNTSLTTEETALVEGYMAKDASNILTTKSLKSSGTDVAPKINPGRFKINDITLKRGYADINPKISEVGLASIKVTKSSLKYIKIGHYIKIGKASAYSPGTVRQLAYKVASS